MVNKLFLLPQEVETFYILPTLRRYIAFYLSKQGMKQKDIAEIMMINTAAISQYHKKRGHKIKLNKEILKEIKTSSTRIHDQRSYIKETQFLLKLIRNTCFCKIHKQISKVPKECKSCMD